MEKNFKLGFEKTSGAGYISKGDVKEYGTAGAGAALLGGATARGIKLKRAGKAGLIGLLGSAAIGEALDYKNRYRSKTAAPILSGASFVDKINKLRKAKAAATGAITHADYLKGLGKVTKPAKETSKELSLHAKNKMKNMASHQTYAKAGLGTEFKRFKTPSKIRERI